MTSKFVVLAAYLMELLGVFFLSVEAIKLPNFYKLRDALLGRISHSLDFRPRNFFGRESDEAIQWTASEFEECRKMLRWFVVFHLAAGWSLLAIGSIVALATSPSLQRVLLAYIHDSFPQVVGGAMGLALAALWQVYLTIHLSARVPPPIALFFFNLMALINPLLLGGMLVGELAHVLIDRSLKGSVALIRFIDMHTANGMIGIMGFLLVALGTLLQILMLWSSS